MVNVLNKYSISDENIATLEAYVDLILRWNHKIQLTATKAVDDFVSRHVCDSLELAEQLAQDIHTMVDIGSGGGLPGVVLAIVRPDIDFLLIEPIQKKHAFLSTARRELGLLNLRTLAVRDEELVQQDSFSPFDAAVARAVWPVETWLERAPRLVRSGGHIYAMEGIKQTAISSDVGRHCYQLEGGRSRSILHARSAS